MKKVFILLGIATGLSVFAQNNPIDDTQNIHIFNDDTNHSLELYYTLFTIDPVSCSNDYQALGPVKPLMPGTNTDYKTYASSTTAAGHPFPIDSWYNGQVIPASQMTPSIAYNQRWSYMKFQLRDPNNPGSIPYMAGSVGFYQSCTGIPNYLTGSGSLNGINYSFTAEAFTVGTDLWINVY